MVLGNCARGCICMILMLKFWHILDRLFSFHCVLEFLSCFSMVLQDVFLVFVLLLVLPLVLRLQLVVIHLLARLLQLY